jgi:hypothetical protein
MMAADDARRGEVMDDSVEGKVKEKGYVHFRNVTIQRPRGKEADDISLFLLGNRSCRRKSGLYPVSGLEAYLYGTQT